VVTYNAYLFFTAITFMANKDYHIKNISQGQNVLPGRTNFYL